MNITPTPTPSGSDDLVDVQVVGGGIAGLVAAALAAADGATVRLIEQHATPGGRARSDHHQGFVLNRGPHALYRCGHLHTVLTRLGIAVEGAPPAPRGSTATMDRRAGSLPVGPLALATTKLLSARSKLALGRFMATHLRNVGPATLGSVTVDEWLDSVTDRPDLRTLLHGLINLTTYNAASAITSADAAVAQLQLADRAGVVYVDGGWSSITAALAQRLPARATVEAQVDAVGTDGNVTWCRTVDGSMLRARATVVAAGMPEVTDRLLGTGGRFAAMAGPRVEASVLDLGLRRPPRAATHLGLDRRLYASVHSVASGLAPAGSTLLSLARYRYPGEAAAPADTRAELRAFAAEVGVDANAVLMERYLHRLVVAGGMPLATAGGLRGRPPVTVAGAEGIHLAGDWVGSHGLLADAAARSAEDAARAAVADARRRAGTLVP